MIRVHSRAVCCDFCSARFIVSGSDTFWPLLKAAKDAGWTRFAEKDRCPACSRKEEPLIALDSAFSSLLQANPDFYGLMADMAALQVRKCHDYASAGAMEPGSNLLECEKIDVPAWKGILIRMSDKWMRLTHFARRGFVKDELEGIEDTLMDLAIYSLLCILAYRRAREAGASSPFPKSVDCPLKEVPSALAKEPLENPGVRGAEFYPAQRRNA